jgi:hypothetical protein
MNQNRRIEEQLKPVLKAATTLRIWNSKGNCENGASTIYHFV